MPAAAPTVTLDAPFSRAATSPDFTAISTFTPASCRLLFTEETALSNCAPYLPTRPLTVVGRFAADWMPFFTAKLTPAAIASSAVPYVLVAVDRFFAASYFYFTVSILLPSLSVSAFRAARSPAMSKSAFARTSSSVMPYCFARSLTFWSTAASTWDSRLSYTAFM